MASHTEDLEADDDEAVAPLFKLSVAIPFGAAWYALRSGIHRPSFQSDRGREPLAIF
jgi:hypothetical protein